MSFTLSFYLFKGHAVTKELLKSLEDVVRIRTFGKSSYPDNIFKSSYVTPCPLNEAMYIVFCAVSMWRAKPPQQVKYKIQYTWPHLKDMV